jgi:hypothetical protein
MGQGNLGKSQGPAFAILDRSLDHAEMGAIELRKRVHRENAERFVNLIGRVKC